MHLALKKKKFLRMLLFSGAGSRAKEQAESRAREAPTRVLPPRTAGGRGVPGVAGAGQALAPCGPTIRHSTW